MNTANGDNNNSITKEKKSVSPSRWLIRLLISLIVLVGLLGISSYGILYTAWGRDLTLKQIAAHLPEGMALQWKQAEGTLAGTLTVYEARFEHENVLISADEVTLSLDILALLKKTLYFKYVKIDDADLQLNPSTKKTSFQWPKWPEMVPDIDLPIIILADDFQINDLRISRKVFQRPIPLIHIRAAKGEVELNHGGIDARQIKIDSNLGKFNINGYYQPRNKYQTNLTLKTLLPADKMGTLTHDGQPVPAALVARGNQSHMELALAADIPQRFHLYLVISDSNQPQWQLDLNSQALDISHWLPSLMTPLTLVAHMNGQGETLQFNGRLQQSDQQWRITESTWKLADQALKIDNLLLDMLGGQLQLNGQIDLSDLDNLQVDLNGHAEQLTWEKFYLSQGQFAVSGGINHWQASGQLHLQHEQQRAQIELDLSGDNQQMHIQQLMALTPEGSLAVTGSLAWLPTLVWQIDGALANFDPGHFLPDWNGRLFGTLHSQGQQHVDTPLQASLVVSQLHGHLRQQPVMAQARLNLNGQQGQGQAMIRFGDSHLHANGMLANDRLNVAVDLHALHLADIALGSGQISGQVQLQGAINQPDISVDLEAHALQWNDLKVEELKLNGQLPWQGEHGQLQLQARALEVGVLLDWVQLQASGSVQNLHLQADTHSDLGALALSGYISQIRNGWQGQLATLRLIPTQGTAWRLRKNVAFNLEGNTFQLEESCLASDIGGALCVQVDWPHEGISLRGEALPLVLLQPWLPLNAGRPIQLRGELTIEGQLLPRRNSWDGYVQVQSAEGGVGLGDNGKIEELLGYERFYTRLDMQPTGINGQLSMGFQQAGYLNATVALERSPGTSMRGEVHMQLSNLYWLEMFSPDLVRPHGVMEGHIALSGTRHQPLLGGQAQLRQFSAELPALGISLSQGQGALEALPDGSARITAQAHTGGKGALQIDGRLSWFGQAQPLYLHIVGDQVLLSDTSELRVIANPDLSLHITGTAMELRGSVHIPEANIDLQRLDRGTSVSEDVVVLDPADPESSELAPLDMDLQISLGRKVAMSGFGLKGNLSGQMQLRARPGRETLANGELEIAGRYKAYGQDLTITQGQLQWNHDIVSDPRLNIRAQRVVGEITAGIHVTGRAHQPWVEIWSDPAMSQSESLAYLVLGRSLSLVSNDEAQELNAASTALSAGSGLLAAQLGAKLGLDDAGVSQSRALGGSVIGVGKYLTPRLYLGYGVSLLGSGSVLTLKYLLRHGFDVEIETSTVENRTSLNWRREK